VASGQARRATFTEREWEPRIGGNRPAVSIPSDQNTTTGMHSRESEIIKFKAEHILNQSAIKYIKLGLL
jgi:hypothetical protein